MAELDKRNSTPPHTHPHEHTHTHTRTPYYPHQCNYCYSSECLPPSPPTFPCFHYGGPWSFITLWLVGHHCPCVYVCVWADKGECTALSLLTVHAVITLRAQHIASDVNSWGDKFTALAELWSTERMCLATFKVDALLHCSALTSPHPQLTPPSHQQQQQ